MTVLTRILCLACVPVLAVGVAAPAFADDAAVDKAMVAKSQVPKSFGKPTNREFVAKAEDNAIVACESVTGEVLVSTAAPSTQFAVTIETKDKKTYTEVNEKVFVFKSAAQATDAFNELFNNLGTCSGSSTLKQPPDITDTITSGSYPGGEFADFWVNVGSVGRGGECSKPCRTVTRSVFVQAGRSIIQTWAYVNGKGQLTGKQKNDLADLAEGLATPWRNTKGAMFPLLL